jgi:hypothetical protein
MTLFSDQELQKIQSIVDKASQNVMITFRQSFGPTKLKEHWYNFLDSISHPSKCVSWWSGASNMGLMECESANGPNIYGQWVLDEVNVLLGVFEIDDEELIDIRAGYDAQSVTDPAMRAMRIGESGGELE